MPTLRLILISLSALSLAGCATTPNRYDTRSPTSLGPHAVAATSPATVRYILPDSQAASAIEVGDVIVSVDGKPVATTWDFYSTASPASRVIRIRDKQRRERDIPLDRLQKPDTNELLISLLEPGKTLSFALKNPAYVQEQDAAFVLLQKAAALISASVWPTTPRYLELYIDLRVNPDCTDCRLENIAVLDQSRNSWLTPVSSDYVAWALYPMAGEAPALMPVPPPTPIGYSATTTSSGTLDGWSYGNNISGMYSGMATTTVVPQYNYMATNMALAYNLGAMIKQSQLQTQGAARVAFVNRRVGNRAIAPT